MRRIASGLVALLALFLYLGSHSPTCADDLHLRSLATANSWGPGTEGTSPFSLDVFGGQQRTWGSSDTKDGGEAYGGGGIVENVHFDKGLLFGVRLGYRPSQNLLLSLTATQSIGRVDWDARFPAIGARTTFSGAARSTALLASIATEMCLPGQVSIRPFVSLGLAQNTLFYLVERDSATGTFVSRVARGTRTSPVAQIGVELRKELSPTATLSLYGAAIHVGDFTTGAERTLSIGTHPITPYEISDAWQLGLGISVAIRF